jgi:hypothetical protein
MAERACVHDEFSSARVRTQPLRHFRDKPLCSRSLSRLVPTLLAFIAKAADYFMKSQRKTDKELHIRKNVAGGATGAFIGAAVGGPVGALVGGIVGTAVGTVAERAAVPEEGSSKAPTEQRRKRSKATSQKMQRAALNKRPRTASTRDTKAQRVRTGQDGNARSRATRGTKRSSRKRR